MTLRFRTLDRVEADDWTVEGSSIATPAKLEAIRGELERGPVIVEHWHHRGASGPDHLVFEDYEALSRYLEANAIAGDAIDVWSWSSVCTPERRLAEGKCPADDGTVPRRGAY